MDSANMSMDGKVVMVTGANSGIGLETSRELARRGARVVMVCRDAAKCEHARRDIALSTGSADLDVLVADLSSQEEVRRLAEDFKTRYDRLDVLVNNAGFIGPRREESVDGIETMMAVNHLAPFLLTNLLLDVLIASAPSRVVTVSSGAHHLGRSDLEDLNFERRWSSLRVYGTTKLMNILFTRELTRRLEGTGVTANAVHPGFVATGFTRHMNLVVRGFTRLVAKTPERGARTPVHVASSSELEGVTGRYFVDGEVRPPSQAARDDGLARRLWTESEGLVGLSTDAVLVESRVCQEAAVC